MSDAMALPNPIVTLELVCPPAMADALARHPALRGATSRRPRAKALHQSWHDTVEHSLAGQDLTLVESAGVWRVERLGLGWPGRPGTPAKALASAIHPAALEAKLGHALPGPLHPVARLAGRMLRLTPIFGGQPMACRILTGTMTVMTPQGAEGPERAVARAEIEGPLAAALGLARALAADLPVTPSLVTLPQEAFRLAGFKPRPQPAPPLDPGMPTDEALAILAAGLISTFLTRLGQIEARTGAEPVHQARVTLRRLRALMLAFRPVLRDAEAALKPRLGGLKDVLAPARDWDVFLSETVDPLARSLDATDLVTGWLKQAAVSRREAAYMTLTEWLRGAAFRDLAWRLIGLGLGEGWLTAPAAPPPAMAEPDAAPGTLPEPAPEAELNLIGAYTLKCLEHRWRKTARPTRELAEMPTPELHGLRIKCKKLRYQAEMFQDVVPGKSGRRLIRRLAFAQETMGQLNDGAVATELVRSLRPSALAENGQDEAGHQVLAAEAIGLIRGYGVGHARDSREAVIQAWRKLVRHNPF